MTGAGRRDFLFGRSQSPDPTHQADPAPSDQSSLGKPAPTTGFERHSICSDELARLVGTDETTSEDFCQLQYLAHQAMACEFAVYAPMSAKIAEASLQVFELVDQLEAILSKYRPDSDISRLNAAPVAEAVLVAPPTASVLAMARRLTQQTGSAFDITSSVLTALWQSASRTGKPPAAEEIASALQSVGNETWDLRGDRATRLAEHAQLDLGAIGKGHALDAAAELMRHQGLSDFLIHGGNSSVLANGNRPIGPGGWQVGLTHPLIPDRRLGTLNLHDCALGTSGTRRQGLTIDKVWYGHIVDPRTGHPGRKTWSATVLAPLASEADALATAFYVLDVERIEKHCREHPHVSAIVIQPDATSTGTGRFSIELFNLSPDSVTWECDGSAGK